MRKLMLTLIVLVLVAVATLAAMIAFGTGAAPPPMASLSDPYRNVDMSSLPAPQSLTARDGVKLAYRYYPAASATPERVVILIHGATASSPSMHPLAARLAAQNMAVYALDMRGHGDSGRRGDLDYPGQLDDDLGEIVGLVKSRHAGTPLALAGFSAGGGFSLHTAATPLGNSFERVVLLSPMLGPRAPTTKPDGSDRLVKPFVPRIIALVLLNRLGIQAFDHLQTLAFGDFGRPELTPNYSFVLMSGFATADYADDLRKAHAPLAVTVGTEDEFFAADRYTPTLDAVRPGIPVTVLPGLNHIEMITEASAVPAIVAALRGAER